MTYCVAVMLDAGMVFASDSRTNAGVDQIATFRKMHVVPGTEDRLLESNLAFVKLLTEHKIPFTFAQSGGGHTPAYWAREVGHSMAVQYAVIQRNLAAARRTTTGGAGGGD